MKPTHHGAIISAGILLGTGMGGFVDGIVLHQILQWHNMLSTVRPPVDLVEMKYNMVWDGLFHAFTWITVAAGLWRLWVAGKRSDVPWSTRTLLGSMGMGWGLFNFIEGIIEEMLEEHRGLGWIPFGTRSRSKRLGLQERTYVRAHVSDGHHLRNVVIRNIDLECVLQRERELSERAFVRAELLHEERARKDTPRSNRQLLRDNVVDTAKPPEMTGDAAGRHDRSCPRIGSPTRVAYGRGRADSALVDYEHASIGTIRDVPRCGSEDVIPAVVPVAADDDEVGVELARYLQDHAPRLPKSHDGLAQRCPGIDLERKLAKLVRHELGQVRRQRVRGHARRSRWQLGRELRHAEESQRRRKAGADFDGRSQHCGRAS